MNILQHEDATRVSIITRIKQLLLGDDSPKWALWLTSPRCEVAYVAYRHGFKQLAALIHRDLASDPVEEFEAGYRIGFREGSRKAIDVAGLAYRAGQSKAVQS